MKKIILYLFLLGTSLSFGATNDLPDNVEKKIRSAVSTFSGSERRENYSWNLWWSSNVGGKNI